jgi:hypothetical protein
MFTKDQGEEENYFGALETKMFNEGFKKFRFVIFLL